MRDASAPRAGCTTEGPKEYPWFYTRDATGDTIPLMSGRYTPVVFGLLMDVDPGPMMTPFENTGVMVYNVRSI